MPAAIIYIRVSTKKKEQRNERGTADWLVPVTQPVP